MIRRAASHSSRPAPCGTVFPVTRVLAYLTVSALALDLLIGQPLPWLAS